MSIGARIRLGWLAGAVLFGCTADSEPGDAGSSDPDGGSADLGPGADGGLDAGSFTGTCEEWCPTFLACRRTRAIAEINTREVVAQCTYPDESAALARCVAHCQTQPMQRNLEGGELATPACLACHLRKPETCQDRDLCKAACNRGWIATDGLEYEGAADLVCWGPEGPTPALECTPDGNGVNFGLHADSEFRSWSYEGPVVVEGVDPLLLRRTDGTLVTAGFSGIAAPLMTLGATVTVSLVQDCPWWCEASMVVFAPNRRWTYAAWSGSSSSITALSDLNVAYRPAACHSARQLCGGALTLELIPQGRADLAVAQGQQTTLDGITYSHGYGAAYFEILCTDVPGARVVGAVQRP
ncbi:MAG: hypothetical protein IPG45_31625 [Deltaproteobacteria bacterium]|nr:hypothetical protein [Deltaproteobacteria bacterium]